MNTLYLPTKSGEDVTYADNCENVCHLILPETLSSKRHSVQSARKKFSDTKAKNIFLAYVF